MLVVNKALLYFSLKFVVPLPFTPEYKKMAAL